MAQRTLLSPGREGLLAMSQIIAPSTVFDSTEYAYSQARVENGSLYLSGQIGVDADLRVVGDAEAQTRQALANTEAILEEINHDLSDVVKVTSYVVDLAGNIEGYRDAWRSVFEEPYPCHTLLGVDQLSSIADGELLVEVEAEISLTDTGLPEG